MLARRLGAAAVGDVSMPRNVKTWAAQALIGALVAGALASPALAATPLSQRYYTHRDVTGMPARPRYGSRIYHCIGGRRYTYRGGWGCDYYVYSQAYTPRRR
jgi:hypothetical protein